MNLRYAPYYRETRVSRLESRIASYSETILPEAAPIW